MVISLYNIYPPNIIRELYQNIPLIRVHHNTLANYPNAFVILILGLQSCHIFFLHFPELHQKIRSFLDLPNPHFLFKCFWIYIFSIWPFLFSRNKHIFMSPGKLTACANSFSNPHRYRLRCQCPPHRYRSRRSFCHQSRFPRSTLSEHLSARRPWWRQVSLH